MTATRRDSLIWLALLATVGFSCFWDSLPPMQTPSRLRLLATQGPGYSSQDLRLAPEEARTLGGAHFLKRFYQTRNMRFVLLAVDGSQERQAIHSPDTCFRGSGWTVAGRRRITLPGGVGEEVELQRGLTTRKALFWYSDGRQRHSSFYWCRLQSALRRFTRGYSNPEPVLMVLMTLPGASLDWGEAFSALPSLSRI